jgi:holliday junction DNA helicase RuvA
VIGFLRGQVVDIDANVLLLDVNGVGYRVFAPTTLLDALVPARQTQIFTHLHVRETELTLYGFKDAEELNLFQTLLGVQGIGPKVALAILSHLPPETLRSAVARDEAALLARVPGIGPKKAKQIVFQLKSKIDYEDVFAASVPVGSDDLEVVAALTALGYSVVEAQAALQQLPQEAKDEPIEEKVRLALSSLSKL